MSFWKDLKRILVTLTCLMMVSSFVAGITVTVKAQPLITLWAVVTDDLYWGRYGGYHDVLYAIRDELAQIGINLEIVYYPADTWYEIVWEEKWNVPGDADGDPTTYTDCVDGWDLFISEWWMMPTGLIPLESLVYSWATPPNGQNIMPWMNEEADYFLSTGMHTLDAMTRATYLWLWQEEYMHDPPIINLYYPRVYEATAVYVEGWDPVVRFHDVSHLTVNVTAFGLYAPPSRMVIGNDTLIYGVVEPVDNFNPLFTLTPTQEKLNLLTHDTLYALSIDPWPPTGVEPDPWNYTMRPDLAADQPNFITPTRARVPLRPNVTWSDGVPFNATDVRFTFDLVLNPRTHAVAYGDFADVVESVEYVPGTYTDPYTGESYDPWVVDFVLVEPGNYADLATLLGIPGASIIPWHTLGDIPPRTLRSHPSNRDWTQYLPGTGPFNLTNLFDGDYIELTRNPLYFGYDPALGWGPYDIDTFIMRWIPDAADRLMALINLEIDFGQPIVAPIEVFQNPALWPNHRVWQYNSPSSNLLYFNLNNPYLSNRYVRQAIAHAIPYDFIMNGILPGWGVQGVPGKTPILPHHYYTDPFTGETVHLFNEDLLPYEYNITKAQMYLDMWYYSQVGTDYTLGPVGDADFSGFVELDDFVIFAGNVGTTSADWNFLPGQDIDPDFNNDDYVGILGDVNGDLTVDLTDLSDLSDAYGTTLGDSNWNSNCDFNNDNTVDLLDLFILCQNYGEISVDFTLWQENVGNYYPFEGAR